MIERVFKEKSKTQNAIFYCQAVSRKNTNKLRNMSNKKQATVVKSKPGDVSRLNFKSR